MLGLALWTMMFVMPVGRGGGGGVGVQIEGLLFFTCPGLGRTAGLRMSRMAERPRRAITGRCLEVEGDEAEAEAEAEEGSGEEV